MEVLRCSVMGCHVNTDIVKRSDNITLHTFPLNYERQAWIEATGRANWEPSENDYICSLHFDEDSFCKYNRVRKLKLSAVPRCFLPDSPSNKKKNQANRIPSEVSKVNKTIPLQKKYIELDYESSRKKYFEYIAQTNHRKQDRKYYTNVINYLLSGEQRMNEEKLTKLEAFYRKRFELIKIDFKNYVIKKRESHEDPILRCIPLEDTFDLLLNVHIENNHARRDQIRMVIKNKYLINQKYIDVLLKSCNVCNNVKKIKAKTEILKPVDNSNKIVVIDIIDMRETQDGIFKYILIYKEMTFLFVLLRPLVTKCEFEVATELTKIFTSFGPPKEFMININENSFFGKVKKYLKELGITCQIPHRLFPKGRMLPIGYIEKCINRWMEETGTRNWAIGCHIVQWRLNNNKMDTVVEMRDESLIVYGSRTVKSPHLYVFGNMPYSYAKYQAVNSENSESSDGDYDDCGDDDDDDITENTEKQSENVESNLLKKLLLQGKEKHAAVIDNGSVIDIDEDDSDSDDSEAT